MGDKGYNQASANLRSVYAAVIGMRSNPGWLDVNLCEEARTMGEIRDAPGFILVIQSPGSKRYPTQGSVTM